MNVSRLRLRLAGGFALAFAIGLAMLAAFGLTYLSRVSIRRLDAQLASIAYEARLSLIRESEETPDSSLAYVAHEVTTEWSGPSESFLFLDEKGEVAASLDRSGLAPRVLHELKKQSSNADFELRDAEPHVRVRVMDTAVVLDATERNATARLPIRIVTFASTANIEADAHSLAVLFAISLPLVLLISLLAGYLLAGRALQPVRDLGNSMAAIAPDDLNTRLVVEGSRGDEVSAVATEFNALLARLQEARARNVQFVREAAHQIRTPLTLVFGEASHALGEGNLNPTLDPARVHATLTRIRSAAEAMRRRVDELFLLAESRTGEIVRLEQQVELDGLVLECTDLMRARARETGHRLAIGAADPVTVQGNASLLQEALLELLENACKYGDTADVITVSCQIENVDATRRVVLGVSSGGNTFEIPQPRTDDNLNSGMGLSIVRWVASSHHAIMRVERRDRMNYAELVFTLA